MNILYDHQIFSRQKYGGISRYFHELYNRIPTLEGDNTEIFAPLYVNEFHNRPNALRRGGIHARKFPGAALAFGTINTVIGNISVRCRRNVTIFHETYYSAAGYAPALAKRVITVYDMIHELFPESFSKVDMTRRNKRRAVRRADHVICISENTRRDVIRLMGIPIEKTSVVYLGHSLTEASASTSTVPIPKQPYLLYVGQRRGYKNFASLLSAFASSTLLRRNFILACFGGGSLTSHELSVMKTLDLKPDKIVCVDGDDAVLASLYSSAAAFVYPSLYEGFGIPPLEAMAHSCPVVCTNTSSLPEVVGNAAKFFDPHDPCNLAEAIEEVVNSHAVSSRLIALGSERIKNFSWEKCARETLNVYKRILRG